MLTTVGQIAETAELIGVKPSCLLDRILCADEDRLGRYA